MPEITRERSGELVRGVFSILQDHPEGLPAREVLVRVEQRVPPTPFEQSEYPNNPGKRRYEKIIRFSTINAVKAGWLIKSRGQWVLTDAGREAYRRFTDPADFMRESVRLYREWRRTHPADDEAEIDEATVETSATTLEEAEEAAWGEIDAYLRQMPPYEFQDLVATLLEAMGYHVAWSAPPGPDRGLDILAYTDPLGAEGPRIKVQVKRLSDPQKVSVDQLRSFLALLGSQDVGIFVCTSGFTRDAEGEARSQENRRLMLIDAQRLFELWVEHWDKIPETDRQRLLPLRPIHFLAPD